MGLNLMNYGCKLGRAWAWSACLRAVARTSLTNERAMLQGADFARVVLGLAPIINKIWAYYNQSHVYGPTS